MRAIKTGLTVAVILLIGAVVNAENKKPNLSVTWDTTMPAIELSNRPLEKVLKEMKAKLPGFDFSISRVNAGDNEPILPVMTIENVTLRQLANLLMNINGLNINDRHFTDDNGAFWHVDVIGQANAAPPAAMVRVFALGDLIAYSAPFIKGKGDHQKQASDDILSMIQAALELQGESPMPTMKIHWPTQTLIFKGTNSQAEIVTNAIASGKLSADGFNEQYSHVIDDMNSQITQLSQELAKRPAATTQPQK